MLEKKKKVDSQCFYLSLIFNAKNQVIKDIDRHVWCAFMFEAMDATINIPGQNMVYPNPFTIQIRRLLFV